MFAKIIRNIERKAHGATPQHYRLVFFDLRLSGIATEWPQVRVGWITGSQRETWSAPIDVVSGSARLVSDEVLLITLFRDPGGALRSKPVALVLEGLARAGRSQRLGEVELDIAPIVTAGVDTRVATLNLSLRGTKGKASQQVHGMQVCVEVFSGDGNEAGRAQAGKRASASLPLQVGGTPAGPPQSFGTPAASPIQPSSRNSPGGAAAATVAPARSMARSKSATKKLQDALPANGAHKNYAAPVSEELFGSKGIYTSPRDQKGRSSLLYTGTTVTDGEDLDAYSPTSNVSSGFITDFQRDASGGGHVPSVPNAQLRGSPSNGSAGGAGTPSDSMTGAAPALPRARRASASGAPPPKRSSSAADLAASVAAGAAAAEPRGRTSGATPAASRSHSLSRLSRTGSTTGSLTSASLLAQAQSGMQRAAERRDRAALIKQARNAGVPAFSDSKRTPPPTSAKGTGPTFQPCVAPGMTPSSDSTPTLSRISTASGRGASPVRPAQRARAGNPKSPVKDPKLPAFARKATVPRPAAGSFGSGPAVASPPQRGVSAGATSRGRGVPPSVVAVGGSPAAAGPLARGQSLGSGDSAGAPQEPGAAARHVKAPLDMGGTQRSRSRTPGAATPTATRPLSPSKTVAKPGWGGTGAAVPVRPFRNVKKTPATSLNPADARTAVKPDPRPWRATPVMRGAAQPTGPPLHTSGTLPSHRSLPPSTLGVQGSSTPDAKPEDAAAATGSAGVRGRRSAATNSARVVAGTIKRGSSAGRGALSPGRARASEPAGKDASSVLSPRAAAGSSATVRATQLMATPLRGAPVTMDAQLATAAAVRPPAADALSPNGTQSARSSNSTQDGAGHAGKPGRQSSMSGDGSTDERHAHLMRTHDNPVHRTLSSDPTSDAQANTSSMSNPVFQTCGDSSQPTTPKHPAASAAITDSPLSSAAPSNQCPPAHTGTSQDAQQAPQMRDLDPMRGLTANGVARPVTGPVTGPAQAPAAPADQPTAQQGAAQQGAAHQQAGESSQSALLTAEDSVCLQPPGKLQALRTSTAPLEVLPSDSFAEALAHARSGNSVSSSSGTVSNALRTKSATAPDAAGLSGQATSGEAGPSPLDAVRQVQSSSAGARTFSGAHTVGGSGSGAVRSSSPVPRLALPVRTSVGADTPAPAPPPLTSTADAVLQAAQHARDAPDTAPLGGQRGSAGGARRSLSATDALRSGPGSAGAEPVTSPGREQPPADPASLYSKSAAALQQVTAYLGRVSSMPDDSSRELPSITEHAAASAGPPSTLQPPRRSPDLSKGLLTGTSVGSSRGGGSGEADSPPACGAGTSGAAACPETRLTQGALAENERKRDTLEIAALDEASAAALMAEALDPGLDTQFAECGDSFLDPVSGTQQWEGRDGAPIDTRQLDSIDSRQLDALAVQRGAAQQAVVWAPAGGGGDSGKLNPDLYASMDRAEALRRGVPARAAGRQNPVQGDLFPAAGGAPSVSLSTALDTQATDCADCGSLDGSQQPRSAGFTPPQSASSLLNPVSVVHSLSAQNVASAGVVAGAFPAGQHRSAAAAGRGVAHTGRLSPTLSASSGHSVSASFADLDTVLETNPTDGGYSLDTTRDLSSTAAFASVARVSATSGGQRSGAPNAAAAAAAVMHDHATAAAAAAALAAVEEAADTPGGMTSTLFALDSDHRSAALPAAHSPVAQALAGSNPRAGPCASVADVQAQPRSARSSPEAFATPFEGASDGLRVAPGSAYTATAATFPYVSDFANTPVADRPLSVLAHSAASTPASATSSQHSADGRLHPSPGQSVAQQRSAVQTPGIVQITPGHLASPSEAPYLRGPDSAAQNAGLSPALSPARSDEPPAGSASPARGQLAASSVTLANPQGPSPRRAASPTATPAALVSYGTERAMAANLTLDPMGGTPQGRVPPLSPRVELTDPAMRAHVQSIRTRIKHNPTVGHHPGHSANASAMSVDTSATCTPNTSMFDGAIDGAVFGWFADPHTPGGSTARGSPPGSQMSCPSRVPSGRLTARYHADGGYPLSQRSTGSVEQSSQLDLHEGSDGDSLPSSRAHLRSR